MTHVQAERWVPLRPSASCSPGRAAGTPVSDGAAPRRARPRAGRGVSRGVCSQTRLRESRGVGRARGPRALATAARAGLECGRSPRGCQGSRWQRRGSARQPGTARRCREPPPPPLGPWTGRGLSGGLRRGRERLRLPGVAAGSRSEETCGTAAVFVSVRTQWLCSGVLTLGVTHGVVAPAPEGLQSRSLSPVGG